MVVRKDLCEGVLCIRIQYVMCAVDFDPFEIGSLNSTSRFVCKNIYIYKKMHRKREYCNRTSSSLCVRVFVRTIFFQQFEIENICKLYWIHTHKQ